MPTSQRGWSGCSTSTGVPYDADFPVVCMDETPRQLIGETRTPVPPAPGRAAREDYEYRRLGTCNVFMATEPLAGRRQTKVTERRTKTDWAPLPARHRRAVPRRHPNHAGDGQPQHAPSRRALRNLRTRRGQGALGSLRVRPYPPSTAVG